MRTKLLPTLLGVVILLIIGFVVFQAMTKKAPDVNLVLSPTTATVKLDNKQKVSDKFYTTPGKHTITASFPGFASNTQSFTVQNNKVVTVTVVLNPNSSAGQQWLLDHADEQKKRQAIVGPAFDESNQQRMQANPIMKLLPHIDNFYRIDYGKSLAHPNDDTAIGIYITYYSKDGLQQALNWLKFEGYNPNSLEIIYQDKTGQGFN